MKSETRAFAKALAKLMEQHNIVSIGVDTQYMNGCVYDNTFYFDGADRKTYAIARYQSDISVDDLIEYSISTED